MAVWSEVFKSSIIKEHRTDAEFFDPKYQKIDDELEKINTKENLGRYSNFIKKGIFDISPTRYKTEGV